MLKSTFEGWLLQDWSIQVDLLELNFHHFPPIMTRADAEKYINSHKNDNYRGKGVFCRPRRAVFSNFVPRIEFALSAVVESTTVSKSHDGFLNYRFSLPKGAFVEVEAIHYEALLW